MNHPPAPPNCAQFKSFDYECSHFETFENGFDADEQYVVTPLECPPLRLRPIIACVARCAWLDECWRLASGDERRWNREAEIARDNAEAWRLWGEQK